MGKALAAWLLVTAVVAAPTTPREVVQSAVSRVVGLFEQAELTPADGTTSRRQGERRAEIRRIASDLFDIDEIARRTLTRHWAARSAAERAEFLELVADLLERGYVSRIEAYPGERIVWLGEVVEGPYAVVRSRLVSRRAEVAVDYRLHLRDDRWRVYDLLIDGMSFVATYRNEFNRALQSSSYPTVVETLRKRLEVRGTDRF